MEDWKFNFPHVLMAFDDKLMRRAFRELLLGTGCIPVERRREGWSITDADVWTATEELSKTYTEEIRQRNVDFSPVRQFKRIDGIKLKERDICQESAKQQVYEYILKGALEPLFHAKILPCQYGSIPGRGPVAGSRKIARLLRRKFTGRIDTVQIDGRDAYHSVTTALVLAIICKYCHKNKPLCWLAGAVMSNYPDGVLIIGGYFSTWAFNLVVSFLIRYLMGLEKVRRGLRIRLVLAVVDYADDILVFGYISNLIRAMKKATRWAASELGITIKPYWQIHHFEPLAQEKQNRGNRRRETRIDMLGYVVSRRSTTIRGGVFIRIRRQLLRAWNELQQLGYVPWWRARGLTSRFGWIKWSNSVKLRTKYHVKQIKAACSWSLRQHERKCLE